MQLNVTVTARLQDRKHATLPLPTTQATSVHNDAGLTLHLDIETCDLAPITVKAVPERGISVGNFLFYSASPGELCQRLADGSFRHYTVTDDELIVEETSRFSTEYNQQIFWCYQTLTFRISQTKGSE